MKEVFIEFDVNDQEEIERFLGMIPSHIRNWDYEQKGIPTIDLRELGCIQFPQFRVRVLSVRKEQGKYWHVVDHSRKEYFNLPKIFLSELPPIWHPRNPLIPMLNMKNCEGYDFRKENDDVVDPYRDKGYEDITEETYQEYLEFFSQREK